MPSVTTYLTPERLKHLDSYQYSSVDLSPISNYILQPWWRFIASLMPIWLAPNAITLIGFGAICLNVLTVWFFVHDLVGPVNRFVYGSFALGLFFYQTMDAVDGKQARATGSSSPLGELFDHGLDTLNCSLGGLIQACALGLGHSKYTFLCIFVGCWSMYVSTWEEFHTGTLYLGYFNGPVEGVLMAVGVLTLTSIKGPGFWAQTVSSTFGSIPLIPTSTQLLDMMMLFVSLAFALLHLPLCLYNVHKTLTSRAPRPLHTPRRTPGSLTPHQSAYAQLLPIVGFTLSGAAWTMSPWSVVMKERYMIEFALLVCLLFGQCNSKIILAQLTHGEFPYSPVLLLPFTVAAIGVNTPLIGLPSLLPPSLEPTYLHLTLLLSLLSYATSSTRVIDAFCSYLSIRCLHIPYPGSGSSGVRGGQEYELLRADGAGGGGDGARRRSNTSERERGEAVGGAGVGAGGRRVARVG